jgi:hypothetical protein
MAVIEYASVIGDRRNARTAEQLANLAAYDTGLGRSGLEVVAQYPCALYESFHFVATAVNNNTVNSVQYPQPWPIKVWAMDVACESAAGSAATVDVRKDDGTNASILSAAVDVKTAAGTAQRAYPESGGKELFNFGDKMTIRAIGTGAGAVVGAQAKVYVQHL